MFFQMPAFQQKITRNNTTWLIQKNKINPQTICEGTNVSELPGKDFKTIVLSMFKS